MSSILGDVFVGVRAMGLCPGLACAGTGNTPFLGRGDGMFARYSFVRERDFTFFTGALDNSESRTRPREKSRGVPCKK